MGHFYGAGMIPICPEQLGGCPTPRSPAEIIGGDGKGVLDGVNRVMTKDGVDVTEKFLDGANKVLKLSKKMNIKKAIFKEGSPSCGVCRIHDGTFSGNTKKGSGVTTELLRRNGILVISEEQL